MTDQSRSLRTGFLLHDVSRLRRSVFDQAMRPYGITRAQWWILSSLRSVPRKGITQTELAKIVDISRVALGEFVDRLETQGYLRRTADPHDRRVNRLHLTAAGEDVVDRMQSVGDDIEQKIHSGFTAEERLALEDMLHKLKSNLLSFDHDSSDQDNSEL